MTKLFLTGATGYIGGDALYAISKAHPEYEITCLVRDSDKGVAVAKEYTKVRLVYGDLDSFDLLVDEAKRADIVCHYADADHQRGIEAILQGLTAHTANNPGYLIHMSGAGILIQDDMKRGPLGSLREEIHDDWDGLDYMTSLPDEAWHRQIEKAILAIGTDLPSVVKTAIISPACIYGPGRGPGNTRSMQVYDLTAFTLRRGQAFMVGEGKARLSAVHVHDLSALLLLLVEAAVSPDHRAHWGQEGYYFAEGGEYEWKDIVKRVASEAARRELIPTTEVVQITGEVADGIRPLGDVIWGTNGRIRAVRARKILGWMPGGTPLLEEIPAVVESEGRILGLIKSHADKAAGR